MPVPGQPTSEFITRVVNRITLVGAICYAILAMVPVVLPDLLRELQQGNRKDDRDNAGGIYLNRHCCSSAAGRKKLQSYSRYLTVVLALIQGIGLTYTYQNMYLVHSPLVYTQSDNRKNHQCIQNFVSYFFGFPRINENSKQLNHLCFSA